MVSNPLTDPEWADRTVDFIDRVVGLVLLLIGLVRGLQAALDALVSHDVSVWLSYFILSALFLVIGIVLMRKRYTPKEDL